jgi:hypothetical protein
MLGTGGRRRGLLSGMRGSDEPKEEDGDDSDPQPSTVDPPACKLGYVTSFPC